jgi:hypothetical protein
VKKVLIFFNAERNLAFVERSAETVVMVSGRGILLLDEIDMRRGSCLRRSFESGSGHQNREKFGEYVKRQTHRTMTLVYNAMMYRFIRVWYRLGLASGRSWAAPEESKMFKLPILLNNTLRLCNLDTILIPCNLLARTIACRDEE